MRRARVRRLVGLLVVVWACSACGGDVPVDTRPAHVRLEVGGVPVRARLARTSAERRTGLAGVLRLEPAEGMLFVYPHARRRRFWMEGCRIALDIAFLDGTGRVFQVQTLPAPAHATDPPAVALSTRPCRLVLEMPAGFFARHGLGVGTQVAIPAAAWEAGG